MNNFFNKIYYCNIAEIDLDSRMKDIISRCPYERKTLAESTKNKLNAHHTYVSGALLYSLLSDESFGFDHNEIMNLSISKDDNGKPFLSDYPNIFFNFSHSYNYVICALSTAGPIGCDVEFHRKNAKIDNIAERFFEENEAKRVINTFPTDEKTKLFYRYWTSQESYIKANGQGLRNGLKYFSLDLPHEVGSVFKCNDIYLKEFDIDSEYSFAVASYSYDATKEFIAIKHNF